MIRILGVTRISIGRSYNPMVKIQAGIGLPRKMTFREYIIKAANL